MRAKRKKDRINKVRIEARAKAAHRHKARLRESVAAFVEHYLAVVRALDVSEESQDQRQQDWADLIVKPEHLGYATEGTVNRLVIRSAQSKNHDDWELAMTFMLANSIWTKYTQSTYKEYGLQLAPSQAIKVLYRILYKEHPLLF